MYKIKVRNEETGIIWWEYGFTNFMMKRLHFLFNDKDIYGYRIYDVLEICAIVCTWKTFKKCLTNAAEYVTIQSRKER